MISITLLLEIRQQQSVRVYITTKARDKSDEDPFEPTFIVEMAPQLKWPADSDTIYYLYFHK